MLDNDICQEKRPLVEYAGMNERFIKQCAILLCFVVSVCSEVAADQPCVYIDTNGGVTPVATIRNVPRAARKRVVCKDKQVEEIVAPEKLNVGRDARTAEFSSELGVMKIRWARSMEKCFATPPARAVGEAAHAVSKALRSSRFISEVKYSRREWQLGFIDKTSAISEFPLALSIGQHPGFMVPPNRIYLISDTIAPDCSAKKTADEILVQVLLHEMGHVVEYILLGEQLAPIDRQRSEGFAVWFEQYSSQYTNVVPRGRIAAYYAALSRMRDFRQPFAPDPVGYAHAGARFQTIVERKGVGGLMKVYAAIREQKISFDAAIEQSLGWKQQTFERQVAEYLERNRR